MTATIDSANVVTATPSGTGTAISQAVTIGASDNFLLVMASAWSTLALGIFSGTPQFNGVNLTKYYNQDGVGFSTDQCGEIWYLTNPSVGTFNFTATCALTNLNNENPFAITLIPMSSVNTASPLGTVAHMASSSLATSSVTATGAGSNDIYVGQGFPFFTSVTTGGSPMVNLFTGNNVNGHNGSISTDSVPGTSAGTFSYTGSGGTNNGLIIMAVAVFGSIAPSAPFAPFGGQAKFFVNERVVQF